MDMRSRGLRVLRMRLAVDEQNAELSFTIGEHYFHLGKSVGGLQTICGGESGHQSDHFGARLLRVLLTGDQGRIGIGPGSPRAGALSGPDSFAAHYGLAISRVEGQLTAGVDTLEEGFGVEADAEMHYLVGRVYWEQGRRDQALKIFQKAVRLDPRFDQAFYSLGLIYWHTNQTSKARRRAFPDMSTRSTRRIPITGWR